MTTVEQSRACSSPWRRTKVLRWLVLALPLALLPAGGCGTIPVRAIPVRAILLADQTAPPGYWAYGYVLFTRRPTETTRARYLAVCEAYLRGLEEAGADKAPKQVAPTYWLLKRNVASEKCDLMLAAYDYPRALDMAASLDLLGSTGPLLVAWDGNRTSALVVDLSFVNNNDEDLDSIINIWRSRIVREPKQWEKGLSLELAREKFRAFVDRYGDSILQGAKSVADIFG